LGLFNINKLTSNISDYIDTRVELIKLDTQEQIVKAVIIMFELLIVFVIVTITMVFLNLTLAYYLNSVLQSSYTGFMIVAGVHVILLGLLWLNKKALRRGFERTIYQMITEKKDFDDEEKQQTKRLQE
jgi:uncharacterized membrane protein YqjE